MCSCGADRNAAQSPFNWQDLTESSSNNHDQDISENDDESEADGSRVKHRACQPFD